MTRPPTSPRPRTQAHGPATLGLCIVLGVVFLLQIAASGGAVMSTPGEVLVQMGGNKPILSLYAGQFWRLLTAAFLHGGLIHVALNVYVLLSIGTVIERVVSVGWMLTAFVFAGLLGNVFSAWGNPPLVVAIGASGGIFGLIAMAAVLAWLAPRETRLARNVLVQWIIFAFVIGLVAGFDNWGHLGGIVGGAIAGLGVVALKGNRALLLSVGKFAGAIAVAISLVAMAFAAISYRSTSLRGAMATPETSAISTRIQVPR